MKHILEYNSFSDNQVILDFIKHSLQEGEETFKAMKEALEDDSISFNVKFSLFDIDYIDPKNYKGEDFDEEEKEIFKKEFKGVKYISYFRFREYGMGTQEEIDNFYYYENGAFKDIVGDAHSYLRYLLDDLDYTFQEGLEIKMVTYDNWLEYTAKTADMIKTLNQ